MFEDEPVDDMQLAVEPIPAQRTKREIVDARLHLLLEEGMRKRSC